MSEKEKTVYVSGGDNFTKNFIPALIECNELPINKIDFVTNKGEFITAFEASEKIVLCLTKIKKTESILFKIFEKSSDASLPTEVVSQ